MLSTTGLVKNWIKNPPQNCATTFYSPKGFCLSVCKLVLYCLFARLLFGSLFFLCLFVCRSVCLVLLDGIRSTVYIGFCRKHFLGRIKLVEKLQLQEESEILNLRFGNFPKSRYSDDNLDNILFWCHFTPNYLAWHLKSLQKCPYRSECNWIAGKYRRNVNTSKVCFSDLACISY